MTPLERARQKKRTCKTCEYRTEINGVSYCEKDGKMLHPMLLQWPGPCPIEQLERKHYQIAFRSKEKAQAYCDYLNATEEWRYPNY